MTTLEDRSAATEGPGPVAEPAATPEVSFDTSPEAYRHWTLSVDGEVATLTLDVAEDGGIVPGYELKMNSYDLGVDIELHDAVQRIRFEHPEVKAVVVTSAKERMFCAGANIKMLAASPHSWKVNFCKFTNETRNGFEDASAHSGLPFLAAVNGTAAGGGYELALACDQIVLVDDNSSAVSLPEVPLLGVLPGTGGLTRVVDKRGVRRDLADVFSTTAEGIRGERAVQWRLVDASVKARDFPQEVARRAAELAARSTRPGAGAGGVALTPLRRETDGDTTRYEHVRVVLDRNSGTATITVLGPAAVPGTVEELQEQGDAAWLLAATRELDDAVLRLRTNELAIGTWLLRTEGDVATTAAYDEFLLANRGHWLVNETIGFYRRTVKRLDTTSRSLFALIEPGSCFVGALAEIAFAADRQFMLEGIWEDAAEEGREALPPAVIRLDEFNTGLLPMSNDLTRLQVRFLGSAAELAAAEAAVGRDLLAADAAELGLVTSTPDDIDWEDEIRLVVEERASFSPDALTGMEANLRFAGRETPETKVFGRLTAWQNWIFQRPNAAGPEGALRRYGTGKRADYDRKRV
ncbi:2,3-epoxybenzoyl-CoA dihydrolase [Geodermatophilus sabuli]|uniref:2,3-dihydro-2,3-dihydroxybenzoyl-CoA ring cleavage enzyme n=1 Tax=Geodermatophilus sabuli TaxID=1564158 RepID=A0A285EJB9_9ACTN|nr:2,3-epoxybenzoyl-CoA dihydrolase [Geodermatophilus sabuli]MBB3083680.1 benzoyl-CoA-dihydrodiol lyase [Geodermatophilus sabuli]SNX99110.1 2,3-dihydro-2,3-dihydroxybenzoyl-CoA ring cleavage enzyme [Geodermatophilus sabuli]